MPRHRRPTALEERLGNPGKRRKNTAEPKADLPEDFAPPRDLKGKIARREWRRVAPVLTGMGVMTIADTAALIAYCRSYEYLITADSLDAAHKAFTIMIRCCKEFGMTASARSGMEVGKPPAPKRGGLKAILAGESPSAAVN